MGGCSLRLDRALSYSPLTIHQKAGRLIMDNRELRDAVEELLHAYVQCIDDDRLEEWPDFFTEDCLYQILPRENAEQGLPIAVMYCDSRGMLQDRVVAHRKATARSNYAVFRTSTDPIHYGTTDVYSVGEYRDKIVFINGVAKFQERIVIVDTSRIQSLLVTPL